MIGKKKALTCPSFKLYNPVSAPAPSFQPTAYARRTRDVVGSQSFWFTRGNSPVIAGWTSLLPIGVKSHWIREMGVLYNSDDLLSLAKSACKRSETDPPEAIVALILSVASFEALLNEMVDYASRVSHTKDEPEEVEAFATMLEDLEQQKAQIGFKIQIANYIFKREKLNKGELPFQDLDLLLKLRNALVHKRPEKWSWSPDDQYEPPELVRRLADRRIISQPASNEPSLLIYSLCCPEVARWSHNVAVQMARFLSDLVPPGRLKEFVSNRQGWESI